VSKISLPDFFRYYEHGNPQQMEAVALLESQLPLSLLQENSAWVEKYRAKPPVPEWPITKEAMGKIMRCSPVSLPDSLMDDYARCVQNCNMNKLEQVYFLGQCGHESAGLRFPLEIASGLDYEGREDLGNTQPGWGVKYAGTGWIQVTGAYWHRLFSEFIGDPMVFDLGKTYTSEKYPWSISGFWWRKNNMQGMCNARVECTNAQIDEIGARVNGRNRPNGADDRIQYTDRAYKTLIGV
jgi:predicted chitinase